MLTLRYIIRSSLLEHSYGENRPGHIDHDRSAIEGPGSAEVFCQETASNDSFNSAEDDDKPVAISIDIIQDPDTGEYRMGT
jgi:hypothetical protein